MTATKKPRTPRLTPKASEIIEREGLGRGIPHLVRRGWSRAVFKFMKDNKIKSVPRAVREFYNLQAQRGVRIPYHPNELTNLLKHPHYKDPELGELLKALKGKEGATRKGGNWINQFMDVAGRREWIGRFIEFLEHTDAKSMEAGIRSFARPFIRKRQYVPSSSILHTWLKTSTHASDPETRERVERLRAKFKRH
ncbi:MAG TPA: hypothetical protein VJA40_06010 [archaeon]|nr:hypothetical protein [archaeon]